MLKRHGEYSLIRLNHRFWQKELLDRLMKACVSDETITYSELTAKDKVAR